MTSRFLLAALAPAALLTAAPALAAPQPITGRYLTEDGSAIVAVAPCGSAICGRIATVLKARPGAPAVDANNKDANLRTRAIIGLPILTGFTRTADDWRGKIYDPRSGKTYKSIVQRNADGTLKVQGCISFFCQTQTWRPAQ